MYVETLPLIVEVKYSGVLGGQRESAVCRRVYVDELQRLVVLDQHVSLVLFTLTR
jgi:hypothetical protein